MNPYARMPAEAIQKLATAFLDQGLWAEALQASRACPWKLWEAAPFFHQAVGSGLFDDPKLESSATQSFALMGISRAHAQDTALIYSQQGRPDRSDKLLTLSLALEGPDDEISLALLFNRLIQFGPSQTLAKALDFFAAPIWQRSHGAIFSMPDALPGDASPFPQGWNELTERGAKIEMIAARAPARWAREVIIFFDKFPLNSILPAQQVVGHFVHGLSQRADFTETSCDILEALRARHSRAVLPWFESAVCELALRADHPAAPRAAKKTL
jgi:hypothetical protein